ncbi:MAG TPA: trypsin-like peptidase domain-containing protein [Halobacteriales archaeon]|nr:trypsin-like peptidase domain-containing protein [Halobacteriales archaeon]
MIDHMPHIDYEHLYRDVLPSVVSIYVSTPRRSPVGGAGSGFVADESGHVITNQHVVGAADRVEVRFSRGDWRVADVVGTDAYTDLAVVHVEDRPAYARPLDLAAENPAPGRPVAALGNPLGLDGSITAGIVSGSNRSMATEAGFAIPDVVQTDAAINPGNSGGPLVAPANGEGDAPSADGGGSDGSEVPGYEVVGVNRAKQGDNIGFAVSAEMVARVVPALIAEGEFRHSYLRIRTMDVTPTLAAANDLEEPRGVLVVDVHPSVPDLYGCGEERRVRGRAVPVGGDVIVGIDGKVLRSHEELMRHLIADTSPGDTVTLDVLRDGQSLSVEVALAGRPASKPRRRPRRGRSGRQVPIE